MFDGLDLSLNRSKAKEALFIFLVVTMAFFFCEGGCGGGSSSDDSSSDNTSTDDSSVTITGDFISNNVASNSYLGYVLLNIIDTAYAFDYTKVKKTLIFFEGGKYKTADVSEGNFSISVNSSSPAGMIFIGDQENFLGYLTLGEGLDSLPLHHVSNNVSKIHLGDLSSTNNTVTASNDVLDNEMPLTLDEKNALANADDLFSSIIKNPDVDNNNKIDFLENKFYKLNILYYMYGGDFQNNNFTPNKNSFDNIINGFKFGLHGGEDWQEVYFTGPDGSNMNHTASSDEEAYDDHTYFYSKYIENPNYPPHGDYLVDYNSTDKNGTLEFTVYDQSNATKQNVLPLPTVHLNNDNSTIHKVTWKYETLQNATLSASSIIERVVLQINDIDKGRVYDSGSLNSTTTEHILSDQNIYWEDIKTVALAYDDVFGNHNVVTWVKKY